MGDQDTSSRPWWSSANKPNSRHSSEKLKVKSSLNSLASALGFKPKKSPTLTIEDPPLPIQRPPQSEYPTSASRLVGSRPPSKSVSSTVSRAESSEPKTPSDNNHNAARHSLLTLSDTDPFAPRGIVTIASPTDPTRLSAYSNHSGPDVTQSKVDDRMSYASSSSLSHSHGSPAEYSPSKKALSPTSPSDSFPSRRIFKRPSETNLVRSQSYNPSDTSARPGIVQPALHKSPSSATLMSSGRPTARPSMRPRGLTDNGMVQKAGFFVQSSPKLAPNPPSAMPQSTPSSSKPLSPRVIVRQASAQRLNPPPAAPPPRHGLPAPPSNSPRLDTQSGPYHPSHSTTSSTISFTSSVSSVEILHPLSPVITPERPRRTSNRSLFSTSASEIGKSAVVERPSPSLASPPLSLKKALSHQSLRRRVSPPTGASTPESEKTPSKRGFPHPRIPLPPLPSLSLRTSNHTPSTPGDQLGSSQDKRASAASSTGGRRRRLFSGSSSRRPSTSNSARGDDDTQSVFSVQSDQDLYIHPSFFKPWMSPNVPTSPSQWEDANPDTAPNSPVRAQGVFSTQQNQTSPPSLSLSPFRKGEISLPRARGLSIRSSDTMFSDQDPDQPVLGAESIRHFHRSNTLSPGSKGDLSRRTTDVARPATAQTPYRHRGDPDVPLEVAVPDPIEQTFTPSSSPPPVVIRSLPPPPRRPRPAPKPEPDSTPVTAPVPKPALATKPAPPAKAVPPPRPTRRRSNKSMEKIIHRRSIMRKPSFLDIDDESEDEVTAIPPGSDIGDSFIDFARESFDTIRSDG